ncbi:MAG: hypothetical protein JWL70_2367 [Acidimicrobiia bacterium]|nr:hypothetical protein [Acidimicrobiia bacterium]
MYEPWPVVVVLRKRSVLKRPLTVICTLLIGVLFVAPTFPPLAQAAASATAPVASRVTGATSFDVAVALSQRAFGAGTAVAYIANGTANGYADAIAAGTAAAHDGAPLLLVTAATIPSVTRRELARLRPRRIVVLGGPSAVDDAVTQQLAAIAGSAVTRRAGADRYATAAAISAGTFAPRSSVAYVVSGTSFADGLTASAAGAGPVLLVGAGSVPASVVTELRRLQPRRIVVIGGPTSVSDSVAARLRSLTGGSVSRVFGNDRYATAAQVASLKPNVSRLYVATGSDVGDALLASAAAAHDNASLVLVSPATVVGPAIAAFAHGRATSVIAVGSRAEVSESQLRTFGLPAGASVARVSPLVPKVIAAARAQIGKPYVFAAAGPNSFDCSGLTLFAWATAGVTLPHFAAAQYDQLPHVPIGLRQPGDLIFYGDPIHHVGLYIGDDRMIQAVETGTNVRIGSIWRNDTYGVGRPG